MRSRFVTKAAVLAVVAVLAGALPALACSCALGDPRDALAEADAAIVGRLRSITDAGGGNETYTFRLKVAVKGSLGARVDVRTPASGASCGLEARVGDRIGLFLTDDGGTWTAGLCSQIEPRVLLRAAEPLPPPDGDGPVRTIVGGNMGPNRLIALDRRGMTLAYGAGDGYAIDVDACPRGRLVVESAVIDRPDPPPRLGRVVVRRTATLRPIWSVTLRRTKWPSIGEVACISPGGRRVIGLEERRGTWFVHEARPSGAGVLWRGDARAAFLDRGRPFVIRDRMLFRVQLDDGRLRKVAPIPAAVDRVTSSPDGRFLAMFQRGAAFDPNRDSRIVMLDRWTGTVSTHTFGNGSSWGVATWADARTIVHLPRSGRVRVFTVRPGDPTLDERASFGPWVGADSALDRGVALGVGWGSLVRGSLDGGSVRTVRRFESPELFALEILPGR